MYLSTFYNSCLARRRRAARRQDQMASRGTRDPDGARRSASGVGPAWGERRHGGALHA